MPLEINRGKIKIGYLDTEVSLTKEKKNLFLCKFAKLNKHQLKYVKDGKTYCVFIKEELFDDLKNKHGIQVKPCKMKPKSAAKSAGKSLRDKPKKSAPKSAPKDKNLRDKPKKTKTACNRRKSRGTCESKKSKVKCTYVKRGEPKGKRSGKLKPAFCRTGKNKKKEKK